MFEASWSDESRETLLDKQPDAPMNGRPRFAVGAELQMLVEVPLSLRVKSTVEEKVSNPFDFATEHPVPSESWICDCHAFATWLLDSEFLFFLFFELEIGVLIIS